MARLWYYFMISEGLTFVTPSDPENEGAAGLIYILTSEWGHLLFSAQLGGWDAPSFSRSLKVPKGWTPPIVKRWYILATGHRFRRREHLFNNPIFAKFNR